MKTIKIITISGNPKEVAGTFSYIESIIGAEIRDLPSERKIRDIINSRLDCPNCDNSGSIPHRISDDEWEPEQCEFCYAEKNSRFNLPEAILTELEK